MNASQKAIDVARSLQPGQHQGAAAKAVGIPNSMVSQAKRLNAFDPELADAVLRGRMSFARATKRAYAQPGGGSR